MDYDDMVEPATSGSGDGIQSSWFTGRWNYRGGNGIYASFGRGGWGMGNSGGRRYTVMMTERYKDWYFYNQYTGSLNYQGTNLESREWMVEAFPNGEILMGTNFWNQDTKSWTTSNRGNDPNVSINMNKIYAAGLNFIININGLPASNALMQQADADYTQRNFLGNPIEFPASQGGQFVDFINLLDRTELNPSYTYFRFILHLDIGGNPIYRYGVIPDLLGLPD